MSDNKLIFLSETAQALFAELQEVKDAVAEGRKPNRGYLLNLAERISQEIPAAALETMTEYLNRVSGHLDSGQANAAMIAQANAGMLNPHDELAALEYERDLLDEKIDHLRWLRDYPEVAAVFEERIE